ncbi:MGMT family protein [Pseudolysinimonas sp.]|uniref:MGMT family protein n=1 Tax=Pseudolysinimonas sp. TaxID=2680009 RepID=UPI002869F092|nr:MGMT family protein [Pseudolysinimonas sp.]
MRSAPAAEFAEAVLEIVATIPPGYVMTYGDVAAVLGSRAARAVGNVMSWYGSDVPWWRVIRASGHAATGHEDRALEHFRGEGTPLITTDDGYRVNLRLARYDPA